MNKLSNLKAKLKQCDLEVQAYVKALQTENAKLQRRIAKLESDNLSLHNRVNALKKQLKENPPIVHIKTNLSDFQP